MFAKNWLALDGCWFLATEEEFGIDTAIKLDGLSWKRFMQGFLSGGSYCL
jgi:hypothetical protein